MKIRWAYARVGSIPTARTSHHFRSRLCEIKSSARRTASPAQTGELERALAIAVRTHRDRIRLFGQMRESARLRNLPHAEARWRQASEDSGQLVDVLEDAITTLRTEPIDGEA